MPVNPIPFEKKENKKPASFKKYLGYRFFKQIDEDKFDIVRVIDAKDDSKMITILKEDGNKDKILYTELKDYTPLDPFGMISFNIAKVYTNAEHTESQKDVMCMMYRKIDLQLDIWEPFAICRQSVNDFFAELISPNPLENDIVGVCVNKDNCPTNINYGLLATCDELIRCDVVSIYKDDTVDSILQCIHERPFNNVLGHLYDNHCKFAEDAQAILRNRDRGWCRTIKDLLEDNNFMTDFNLMCEITGVEFDMFNILNNIDGPLYELSDIGRLFFSEVFKVRMVRTRVIQFDYTINMGDFNNHSYVMIRDINNNIFVVVYMVEGEFLEAEIEEELSKLSVSERLKLSYYDKYGNSGKGIQI